jgi:hypothetical protein
MDENGRSCSSWIRLRGADANNAAPDCLIFSDKSETFHDSVRTATINSTRPTARALAGGLNKQPLHTHPPAFHQHYT